MKKRAFSVLLILAMVVGILPTSAYAEGTDPNTIPQVPAGKAMVGTTEYESLPHAIVAAGQMDENTVTIYLGSGEYTLKNLPAPGTAYEFGLNSYWKNVSNVANQNLIFIGQDTTKTTWKIGNGAGDQDQSFAQHQATITFKNMTLETTDNDKDGFSHCTNITVEDCTVKNRIYNWCNGTAIFKNTTFDVGSSGYALFTYSATRYDFENCTFNLPKNGQAIRGYRDYENQTVTINFKDNTINSPDGSVGGVIELDPAGYTTPKNINYIVNFLGTENQITDNNVTPNPITCSEWFSITAWRVDRKEGALWQTQNPWITLDDEKTSELLAKVNITATINFNGTTVWQDGRWADGHDGTYNGKWKTWGCADSPNHKEKIYSSTQTPETVKETVRNSSDWSHEPAWSTNPNTAYATDPVTGQEYRHWVEWCKYCHHIYDSGTEYKSVTPSTCTVTFKVVNGTWNDGTTTDKTATVALTAGKGTLNSSEVPAVGTKPNANYQAGSWDVTPNTATDGITGDVTYTYTYAPTTGSATVTFKVVNGTWNDGTTTDKTSIVTLTAGTGTLPSTAVPTGMQASTGYEGGSWDSTPNVTDGGITGNVTYTYTYEPAIGNATVTFKVVNGTWDDETAGDKTATVALTAGKGTLNSSEVPAVGTKPNANYQAGSWDVTPNTATDGITGDVTYTYTYAPTTGSATVTFKVVNGTWDDETAGDKTATVALTAGKGTLNSSEVPAVGTKPNANYQAGSWDVNPDTNADGITGDVTYTYSFKATQNPPLPPVIPSTGSVTLTKVDSEDKNTTLANVVFDLYKADGTLEGTYITGANGKITVRDLPAGKHYWIEIRPAEGYMLDTAKHEFTVSGGKTTQISIANTRTAVPNVFSGDHYAYVIGYDDGLVHPEANITRAEVTTIFFRLLDDAIRDQYMTKINSFSDVQQGMWFNTAVSTMAAMGIVNGYPDGNFYPNAKITRAEFAAIAARFDSSGNTTGVSFRDIYGHWAQKEINVAYNNGWILGYEDGTFKPNQNITRAEAITLINRVLQRVPENKSDLLEYMVEWPDNMDITKWYYLSVQEATNSHDYGRKKNGYEYWTELREVRDWAALEQ